MAGVIENIGLKFDFKAHFQYVFVSHKYYRWIIILTQKNYCVTIESNVRINLNII